MRSVRSGYLRLPALASLVRAPFSSCSLSYLPSSVVFLVRDPYIPTDASERRTEHNRRSLSLYNSNAKLRYLSVAKRRRFPLAPCLPLLFFSLYFHAPGLLAPWGAFQQVTTTSSPQPIALTY